MTNSKKQAKNNVTTKEVTTMNELRCPKCGEKFDIDEAGYAAILKQVRDKGSSPFCSLYLLLDYHDPMSETDILVNRIRISIFHFIITIAYNFYAL